MHILQGKQRLTSPISKGTFLRASSPKTFCDPVHVGLQPIYTPPYEPLTSPTFLNTVAAPIHSAVTP